MNDTYYYQSHVGGVGDGWHQVSITSFGGLGNAQSAMTFDSDDDVLEFFWSVGDGTLHVHIYCPTLDNPTPGTLRATQTSAQCTSSSTDNWAELTGISGTAPLGVTFPGVVYDTVTHRTIYYGGQNLSSTTFYRDTLAFNLSGKSWTAKCQGSCTPPNAETNTGSNINQPAMAYDSLTHKVYYHQSSGRGAPQDYVYDPSADTWTAVSATCPSGGCYSYTVNGFLVFDGSINTLVEWTYNKSLVPDVWQGRFLAVGNHDDFCCDSGSVASGCTEK